MTNISALDKFASFPRVKPSKITPPQTSSGLHVGQPQPVTSEHDKPGLAAALSLPQSIEVRAAHAELTSKEAMQAVLDRRVIDLYVRVFNHLKVLAQTQNLPVEHKDEITALATDYLKSALIARREQHATAPLVQRGWEAWLRIFSYLQEIPVGEWLKLGNALPQSGSSIVPPLRFCVRLYLGSSDPTQGPMYTALRQHLMSFWQGRTKTARSKDIHEDAKTLAHANRSLAKKPAHQKVLQASLGGVDAHEFADLLRQVASVGDTDRMEEMFGMLIREMFKLVMVPAMVMQSPPPAEGLAKPSTLADMLAMLRNVDNVLLPHDLLSPIEELLLKRPTIQAQPRQSLLSIQAQLLRLLEEEKVTPLLDDRVDLFTDAQPMLRHWRDKFEKIKAAVESQPNRETKKKQGKKAASKAATATPEVVAELVTPSPDISVGSVKNSNATTRLLSRQEKLATLPTDMSPEQLQGYLDQVPHPGFGTVIDSAYYHFTKHGLPGQRIEDYYADAVKLYDEFSGLVARAYEDPSLLVKIVKMPDGRYGKYSWDGRVISYCPGFECPHLRHRAVDQGSPAPSRSWASHRAR